MVRPNITGNAVKERLKFDRNSVPSSGTDQFKPNDQQQTSLFCRRNFVKYISSNVNVTHLRQRYVGNALMKLGPDPGTCTCTH